MSSSSPLTSARDPAARLGSRDQSQQSLTAHSEKSSLAGSAHAHKLYDTTLVGDHNVAGKYDIQKIATMRVFFQWKGSVFESRTLWWETSMISSVFILTFTTVWVMKHYFHFTSYHEFIGKESEIRAFLSMFSALIGLLLAFYTGLNLTRWWEFRMGVHDLQEGAAKLSMYLSQGVTSDQDALNAVHRYSRASLFLIFAASQVDTDKVKETPLERAVVQGLLTEGEGQKLKKSNAAMPFIQAGTLWMWLANLVYKLNDQNLLKGPPHLCSLLAACDQGRSGVSHIQTLLQTPIPMGYVHLLCLMVKLHNIILSLLYALVCVMYAGGHPEGWDHIALFRTAFRAFFMPFMYNALLILNTDITDPFGQDSADFDYRIFDTDIEQTLQSATKAAGNLPDWMANNKKFAPFDV